MNPWLRTWLIVLNAFVVTAVASTVAMQALLWSLPESDGAYGSSVADFMLNPMVLLVVFMMVGPFFLIGCGFASERLSDVRLTWAVPRIAAAMVGIALVTGYLLNFLSMLPVFAVGLMVISWCSSEAKKDPRLRCEYDPETDWRDRPPRDLDQST